MPVRDINWNDYPAYLKRGTAVVKKTFQNPDVDIKDGLSIRTEWFIDLDMPQLKGDDRAYLDNLVNVGV